MKNGGRRSVLSRVATGLAATLLLAVSVFSHGVMAATATNEGITMSPVNKHYDLQPGETVSDTLLVINHGKTDYDFRVFARGYDVESETYSAITGNIANPMADIGDWVSFEQTVYHLKSGENATVPYTITVPQKVTPGAHTGAVYAEIQPVESTGLVLRKSVGLVLYANLGGTAKQEGRVESVSMPSYLSTPPLVVTARFLNTGTTYYIGTAEATVYDLFGHKITEQSKEFTVLPDRPRKVDVTLNSIGIVGLYKVEGITKVFDTETPFSQYVLVLPLWLIIGVILALAGLIFFVRYRKESQKVHFRARQ